MNLIRNALTIAAGLACAAAFAQTPAPAGGTQEVIQRQADQQQRIDNGLKDGSLTTREAGRLEKGEASLDRTIARDQKNGMTAQDVRQINRRENQLSHEIHNERTNAVRGNPNSASSRRMQADVQRNANQDRRMAQGVKDGQLTGGQVAGIEHGQAHVDRAEARAAANGHVGAGEQRRIQRAENHQSQRIHHDRTAG